ncbi:hypothetical protein SNA_21015 [Streptomyces natalensis ATCC 27448]|uniref:Uncharacterized protein n=1 Tax=Streptomyces natalensis ATCC 27448 TaxID=1240678 RepID=A0A0D7CID2_9ACTN|nr:hypothetical protein SNA_21015 [Streptomyces natalensis ATCC 27448]
MSGPARVWTDQRGERRPVVRLCDPATEIVNGTYYDRDQRVEPAPVATEERTLKCLTKLAGQLVGQHA